MKRPISFKGPNDNHAKGPSSASIEKGRVSAQVTGSGSNENPTLSTQNRAPYYCAPDIRTPYNSAPYKTQVRASASDGAGIPIPTRIDDSLRSYTVVDVIKNVFGHNFAEDLKAYILENPEEFINMKGGWSTSRVWVNRCKIQHIDTLYFQSIEDFTVDVAVDASLTIEIQRPRSFPGTTETKEINIFQSLWLEYILDLLPCRSSCWFNGVIVDPANTLLQLNPGMIQADKQLLPVLRDNDYEYIAGEIRREYGFNIVPLNVEDFVRRLNLNLVDNGYFPDNDILGEFFFEHGTTQVIDPDTGEIHEIHVKPLTIVVNGRACTNRAIYISTVLHEIVHFLLGIKYFFLQRLVGQQLCSYLCKRSYSTATTESRRASNGRLSPVDIMEIHANTLPGYIMITDKDGKATAEKLLESYPEHDVSVQGNKTQNVKVLRRLVRDMAEHYTTTQCMARTRLKDMGYKVGGILQSANDELVPDYISDLDASLTYTIGKDDALAEYLENKEFQETINSGRYVYCEGHFCLRDSRYLWISSEGYIHMTMYAREHMSECCLVFENVYPQTTDVWPNGEVYRVCGKDKKVMYVSPTGESLVTPEGLTFHEDMRQKAQSINNYPSFPELLVDLMTKHKMTVDELSERTGISNRTIIHMRKDHDRNFSYRHIFAICIGLQLDPLESIQLVKTSRARPPINPETAAYLEYLLGNNKYGVDQVNNLLIAAAFNPLTRLGVEEFTKDGEL